MAWNLFFVWVGTAVLAYALTPKPKIPKDRAPATIDDFDFPTAEDGREIPVLFGTREVSGPNVVWFGDLRTGRIREKVDRGLFRSSKKVTVGFRYFLGMHKGLVHGPVDVLQRIRVADKVVWVGAQEGSGSFEITQPKIFGGKDGEGGIEGTFTFANGEPLQLPSEYLQENLGEPIPAFRGVSCGILEQMYVSANNPYLKPWAFYLTRTDVTTFGQTQWYVEKARIGVGSTGAGDLPYDEEYEGQRIKFAFLNGAWGDKRDLDSQGAFTPESDIDVLVTCVGGGQIANGSFGGGGAGGEVVTKRITLKAGVEYWAVVGDRGQFSSEPNVFSGAENNGGATVFRKKTGWSEADDDYVIARGGGDTATSDTPFSSRGGGHNLGTSCYSGAPSQGANAENRGGVAPEGIAISSSVWCAGTRCFSASGGMGGGGGSFGAGGDGTSGSVVLTGADFGSVQVIVTGGNGGTGGPGTNVLVGANTHYFGPGGAGRRGKTFNGDVSNTDCVLENQGQNGTTQKISGSLAETTFGAGGDYVDGWGTSGAGINFLNGISGIVIVRTLPESSCVDMNPAHIIRECLTDKEWGMGYSESDIDDASFIAAADTLFDEQMGISILWQRENTIEAFVQDVVRHIDAALYVDRRTGKFVLKLIRADYDPNALITLTPDNIERVENYKRPAFGDLVNSVTVIYDDCDDGRRLEVPE
jgi:hypothetical protein